MGTPPANAAGQPPGPPVPAAGGSARPLPAATATPPQPGGPAGDPDGSLATERFPLGIQAIAVTADVQAPKSMNLNQEATLRIAVGNTGTSEAINVRVIDELPEGLEYRSVCPRRRRQGSLLSWSLDVARGVRENHRRLR